MAQKPHSEPLHIDTQLGSHFNVGTRFTELCAIGYGCNGLVYAAKDRDCDKKVAIKKISFHNKESCKYALREVKIMRRLDHENIISVYDILGEGGRPLELARTQDLRAVYIVQELLDTDLNVLIHRKSLQPQHIQWFLYQLLRALKYIHSANVLHRDLKPSNLLVNCEDLTLKITDFGLARVLDPVYNHSGHLTENVGTFWYKSPELILTPRSYSKATDMWSVGCILAEMLLGHPLFPGLTDLDQLHNILDSAELTEQDWSFVTQTVSNKLLKNHPLRTVTPLAEKMGTVDAQAYSLLLKMLKFRSGNRITAEEALCDPYLRGLSLRSDEPSAAHPLRIEHEVDDLSPSTLKDLILSESTQSLQSCGQSVDISSDICREQDKPVTETLVATPNLKEEALLKSELPSDELPSHHNSSDSLHEASGPGGQSQLIARTPEEMKSLTDSQNELEKLNNINARKSSSSESLADSQNGLNSSRNFSSQKLLLSENILTEDIPSQLKKEDLCIHQDPVAALESKEVACDVCTSKVYDKTQLLQDSAICDKKVHKSEWIPESEAKDCWSLQGSPKKWAKAAKESFKIQDCDFSEKDEAEMSPRKLEEDLLMAQQDWDSTEKLEWVGLYEAENRIHCDNEGVLVQGDKNTCDVSDDVMELNKKNRSVDMVISKDCDIFLQKDNAGDQSLRKELHLSHFSEIENYKEYFSPSPKSGTPTTDDDMETRLTSAQDLSHTDGVPLDISAGSYSSGWITEPTPSSARGSSTAGRMLSPSMPWADKNARDGRMQPSPSSDSSDCDNVWWEKWQEKELSERLNQYNIQDSEESLIDNEVASGSRTGNSQFNVKKKKTQVNLQSHAPSRHDWDKNRQVHCPTEEEDMWSIEQEYRLPSAHLPRDRHRTNQRLKELRHRFNEDRHLAEIAMHERINERLKLEDQGLGDQACGGVDYQAGQDTAFQEWLCSEHPDSPPTRRRHSRYETPLIMSSLCEPTLPHPHGSTDADNSSPSYGAKPKGVKHVSKSSK